MSPENEYKENSQAVQAHLTIQQAVIQRMAGNSASSKAWCVTLVSAILVIIADKGKPQYTWIAIMPTLMFLILDAYYLALEKEFRNSYNSFIQKLHEQSLSAPDLFVVTPKSGLVGLFFKSLGSFSVWPFYAMLFGMIYAIKAFVI